MAKKRQRRNTRSHCWMGSQRTSIRRVLAPAFLGGLALLLSCSTVPESPTREDDVAASEAPNHPLDPLTSGEIESAADIVRGSDLVSSETRFALIELAEPEKSQVRDGTAAREALLVAYDWAVARGYEVTVNLERGAISSWKEVASKQPPTTYTTMMRLKEALYNDPRWIQGLERLGLEAEDSLAVGPEHPLESDLPLIDGEMVVPASAYVNNTNAGVASLPFKIAVNLTKGTVVDFEDSGQPLASADKNIYEPQNPRTPLEPMSIEQSQGPSFTHRGSKIEWQNWTLHYGVNVRRGLEIYDVSYRDDGRQRPVLYRASVAEMITPYGDRGWIRWYPIDEGDLNLVNYSQMAVVPGEDAPPNALYAGAVGHDHYGNAISYDNAVAIFERDGGILWRHWNHSRRARELVLTSVYTVDNYDYALSWILHQDGTIETEMLLSGIINAYRVEQPPAADPLGPWGHVMVAPTVAGPIHQHFFSYRLDLDVDGTSNTLVEHNSERATAENPEDEWFHTVRTVLGSEETARRSLNVASSRTWHVENRNRQNSLGQHPAYVLEPGKNTFPLTGPRAPARRKMEFIDHHLWATQYAPTEMYPAGLHTAAGIFGDGLPRWTEQNRALENQDLVLWHTTGITHLPRPEDWPIMPSRRIGFRLTPFSFFDANPAMDVAGPHPWE